MLRKKLGEGMTLLAAPFLVLSVVAIATVAPAVAQLNQAKSTELQNAESGAAAQKTVESLDDQRDNLLQEYRPLVIQLERLKEYNDQLEVLIENQGEEITSKRAQIESVSGMGKNIVTLMNDMLAVLEEFVELDTPFLEGERRKRVLNLKSLMNRADVTNAEKYRRVLEAYQIENDYGRTIEAFDGKLGEGEDAQTVTYLKVGRVAYLYQTRDGSESFVFNNETKAWDKLPGDYDTPITIAIRMAREQIPPDLIFIPVTLEEAAS